MRLTIAVVCLALASLTGCDKATPTTPTAASAVDFGGTWTGTMTPDPDSQGHFNIYPMKLTLVQTGDIISGSWNVRLGGESQPWREATLSGSTDGVSLVVVLTIETCVASAYGHRSGNTLSLGGFGFDGRGIRNDAGGITGCPTNTPITIALTKD